MLATSDIVQSAKPATTGAAKRTLRCDQETIDTSDNATVWQSIRPWESDWALARA
jgi:hypothetical protein